MKKARAWACLHLLLVAASAAVIPSGSLALPSATSSTLPSSTERSQTLVTPPEQLVSVSEDQSSPAEDETRLEASPGRQKDVPPVTTVTLLRTVTVDVVTETRFIFQPVEQTLTFTNPVLVLETHTIAVMQPSNTIAARGKANTAAFDQGSHPAALPAYPPQPKEAALFAGPARARRQLLGPVPSVSTTTVEITTTLTVGSVRTITAFNQVFVSVTVNRTVTTTMFVTMSTGTAASFPPANPTPPSGEESRPTNAATFASGSEPTGTTTFFAPSETSAGAGVTARSSMPSGARVQRPTESTAASSTEAQPDSAATAAPSAVTATPEPASGRGLSSGTIASISLGVLTGVLFLLFLCYVYRCYRRYAKNRQGQQPPEENYKTAPATATSAIEAGQPAVAPTNSEVQNGATPGGGEARRKSVSEPKQIRVVIKPAGKRQSKGGEGSGKTEPEAGREDWQRASGYSVSVAGGSDSTLRDTAVWSTRSDYGSTTKRTVSQYSDIPAVPALGAAAQMKERR
ncbi:hypothetical protein LX36DRAFT_681549 [Colletotrichum falcatum]|nr:hypothetical protein LX36DRAFT_681549 [Colletotrichum falcatum]